ncbi:MAG: hypothetical protein AB1816_00635 [Bacillota bacterium]
MVKYRAHRISAGPQGETYHEFIPDEGPPVSKEKAEKALEELASKPLPSQAVTVVHLGLFADSPIRDYDDGKVRTVTVRGQKFQWVSDGRYVTVYKDGVPVLRYSGDPHDRKPSGVRTMIREELL